MLAPSYHHDGIASDRPRDQRSHRQYCIQYSLEAVMPIRLNITMDEDIYRRLKRELPSKGISSFIEAAVRARFHPDRATLDAAYKAARKEKWRAELSSEWAVTESESWPSSAPLPRPSSGGRTKRR